MAAVPLCCVTALAAGDIIVCVIAYIISCVIFCVISAPFSVSFFVRNCYNKKLKSCERGGPACIKKRYLTGYGRLLAFS